MCFLQKINEKPQVIADYECGKAIPNNQVMGKIERALGEILFLFFCFRFIVCSYSILQKQLPVGVNHKSSDLIV